MSSDTGSRTEGDAFLDLKAETLVVVRRPVTGQTVQVSTVTREVELLVDERLANERVDVERVPIGRIVQTMPTVREEDGVTIIPVVEETLVVERRLILKEEIRITRRRVEERHIETVVLRQQDAVVARFASKQQSIPRGEHPMEHETIVAVYDTAAHAQAAVRDLEAAHVPSSDISQHAKDGSTTGTSRTTAPVHEKGFWASLFGGEPDHDTSVYGHSIDSGSTVITVRVAPKRYDEAAAILEKHNPIDLDERSEQYGLTGGSAATPTGYVGHAGMTDTAVGSHGGAVEPAREATEAGAIGASGLSSKPVLGTQHGDARATETDRTGSAVGLAEGTESDKLQLAEERLEVGKRAVRGGTTRIRRYTVEKPVEENVTLHSERVVLDRRPVTDGRVLANADFTDKTISMTEMNEEAVASKSARVVEEIGLRKEASDRVETVRDTVRRDEVEVEEAATGEHVETGRNATTPVERKI